MLSYPLMWDVTWATAKRNLHVYSDVAPEATPSTTWAMFAINWLGLGEEEKAQAMFKKSIQSYVSEPFKVSDLKFRLTSLFNYLSVIYRSYIKSHLTKVH